MTPGSCRGLLLFLGVDEAVDLAVLELYGGDTPILHRDPLDNGVDEILEDGMAYRWPHWTVGQRQCAEVMTAMYTLLRKPVPGTICRTFTPGAGAPSAPAWERKEAGEAGGLPEARVEGILLMFIMSLGISWQIYSVLT